MATTFHHSDRPHGPLRQVPDRHNNFMRHCNVASWPGVRFRIEEIEEDALGHEWYLVKPINGGYESLVLRVAPRNCHNVY